MKNAKIVSGRAAILIVRMTALASSGATGAGVPLLELRCVFEPEQACVPEVVQEGPQLGQPFRAGPVQPARALPALCHEPGAHEHPEMLRDRRPRDLEV